MITTMKKAYKPPVFIERCPATTSLEQHGKKFQKEEQKLSSRLEYFSNHGTNMNHDMKSKITIDSPEETNIRQKAIKLELLQDQVYNDTNDFNHQLNIISPRTEFETTDIDEDRSDASEPVKRATEKAVSYCFHRSFDPLWTPECNPQEAVINAQMCNLECIQQQQLKTVCNANEINARSELANKSAVSLQSAREIKIERGEIPNSYNSTHLTSVSYTHLRAHETDS